MSRSAAILQVLPALASGGVERGTLEIAEAIVASGLRPIVASAGGRLVPELQAMGGLHVELPLTSKSPFTLWRNSQLLAALVRTEGVRIIHARSRAPGWSAFRAAKLTGVPFVTTYHGTYGEGIPGKRFYNSVMARGQPVIAISRFIADHVHAHHGVPPERIRIVPRGVDLRRFDPDRIAASQVASLRSSWGVEGDGIVILLPARLARWKGQAVLLEAMRSLPGMTAVLAGDLAGRERYAAELQSLATAHGMSGRVRFAGHVSDMPTALMAADLVIHASTQPEAFGRTVVEAQAMARPVIAADLGGPRETVTHGVTGWLVPPGNVDALAGQIREVLAMSPSALEAVGQAARQQVPTMEAMQAATMAIYGELL